MARISMVLSLALGLHVLAAGASAQMPNHPVITEVYGDPPGLNDGPVGSDPASNHQEFFEIYLPPAASLAPGLNKDALKLTLYEVEGDADSTGPGLVNYRFDLPTFDLDSSNGITSGAIARPPTGVVVLGWVDYVGDPPTALAGTPSTRLALINGGITTTGGSFTFIAINGHHFGGTTNFPILTAESLIDLPAEATSGVVQNGSGAYLLVNRDTAGYAALCDDQHAGDCPAGADPTLPNNATGLSSTALLDGLAGNDHPLFLVTDQPYDAPTGDEIDLEAELPLGGAFSLLVAQIPELDTSRLMAGVASGYARLYADAPKTTETGSIDDPALDAQLTYRQIRNDGPFFPSPGRAALTSSPPELSVAAGPEQTFGVLKGTTGRPGLLSANVGGDFPINMLVTAATSNNPSRLTMSAGAAAAAVAGQTLGFPQVALTPTAAAVHGEAVTGSVTVTASNAQGGDPAVVAPMWSTSVTATVLDPVNGTDENGLPLEATVFAAIQGIVAGPAANEFLPTDLGSFVAGLPDPNAIAGMGNAVLLTNAATNISAPLVVQPLIKEFPDLCCEYINPAGAVGTANLLQTVLNSAEVQSGAGTYDDAIATCTCPAGSQTAVRAISVNHPDSFVYGGTFTTSQLVHFAEPGGFVGDPRSGLSNATTTRTFELALLDTNVTPAGTLETGATDDFGIVVEVALTEPGAPVVTGEYVFLSFMGGMQGADFDTLQVVTGNLVATIIYLDLDNLHEVLGIRSIERVILVDGSGSGEADIIEAFCLNATAPGGCTSAGQCNDNLFCTGEETCVGGSCLSSGNPCTGQGLICNEGTDSCVATPVCPEGTAEECADLDQNGLRDDNCLWWACVGGLCAATEIPFGDMGGNFGACLPDLTADGNDRFHALNCFANKNTTGGNGYPCEPGPPQAFNVDAGGQFGACAPDGVCDGNDAFHAVNAFANLSSCSCPLGGPQPGHGKRQPLPPAGRTRITLQAPIDPVRGGELVQVDVYLAEALPDLRGYQLHVGTSGGSSGRLQLIDISIAEPGALTGAASPSKSPYSELGTRNSELAPYWSAFNVVTGQMVAGLDSPGVAAAAGSYLATFIYRASEDAAGVFVVELLHDSLDPQQRTFLFPTPASGRIEIVSAAPAVIEVRRDTSWRRRVMKTRSGS